MSGTSLLASSGNSLAPTRYRSALEGIVREAGALALSRQAELAGLTVSTKGRLDYVTDVDRIVEGMVAQAAAGLFPEDGFVGEEGRRVASRSGNTWIVDPIDGTHNYLRGGASWAISVGVVSRSKPIAAATAAPAEGCFFTAEAGLGIWRNGLPFSALTATGDASIAFTGVSTGMSTEYDRWLSSFVRDDLGLADRRTGSAVTSLLAVIQGQADLYIGFGEHAWDVAGAAVLAEEAGCAHTLDWTADIAEGPLTFVCGRAELVERTLAAISVAKLDRWL
jgi:myo-inositol-1(or 4)-monophosphatase